MNQFRYIYNSLNVEDLIQRSFKFCLSKSHIEVNIINYFLMINILFNKIIFSNTEKIMIL